MKANFLSFVFNNFLESGLFKALRPIQIKKIAPSKLAPEVVQNACAGHANPTDRASSGFGLRKYKY
jgi:hypothetical protein